MDRSIGVAKVACPAQPSQALRHPQRNREILWRLSYIPPGSRAGRYRRDPSAALGM